MSWVNYVLLFLIVVLSLGSSIYMTSILDNSTATAMTTDQQLQKTKQLGAWITGVSAGILLLIIILVILKFVPATMAAMRFVPIGQLVRPAIFLMITTSIGATILGISNDKKNATAIQDITRLQLMSYIMGCLGFFVIGFFIGKTFGSTMDTVGNQLSNVTRSAGGGGSSFGSIDKTQLPSSGAAGALKNQL
jgi:hypothetical protein